MDATIGARFARHSSCDALRASGSCASRRMTEAGKRTQLCCAFPLRRASRFWVLHFVQDDWEGAQWMTTFGGAREARTKGRRMTPGAQLAGTLVICYSWLLGPFLGASST